MRKTVLAALGSIALVIMTGCASGEPPVQAQALDSPEAADDWVQSTAKPQKSKDAPSKPRTETDSPAARRTFQAGLADYCTSFYVDQRKADQQFPGSDRASLLAFDKLAAQSSLRTAKVLDTLTPPTDLASTFKKFIANADAIYDARIRLSEAHRSSTDPTPASNAFTSALDQRYPLARKLGAAGCDGQLPQPQQQAAIAATRAFVLTKDSAQACGSLVTPDFVQTQWAATLDPMGTCVADREEHSEPGHAATDIEVSDVTGVEQLTATVHYVEKDGCCAMVPTVARLHYLDGAWKIRSLYYE